MIPGFHSAPHTGHGADIGRLFCILQKQPSTVQIFCKNTENLLFFIFKLKLKIPSKPENSIFAELLLSFSLLLLLLLFPPFHSLLMLLLLGLLLSVVVVVVVVVVVDDLMLSFSC